MQRLSPQEQHDNGYRALVRLQLWHFLFLLQARIAAMEKALLASQERVAAATRKFDAILSDIRDVKETLARREVRLVHGAYASRLQHTNGTRLSYPVSLRLLGILSCCPAPELLARSSRVVAAASRLAYLAIPLLVSNTACCRFS